MHTKDALASALREAHLTAMADRAADGYYDDFLSPLETPDLQLTADLSKYIHEVYWPYRESVRALLARHQAGEFVASIEESSAWAGSEAGQDTICRILGLRD